MRITACLFALILSACGAQPLAPSSTTAELSGRIVERPSNVPIANATITIESGNDSGHIVKSDVLGYFRFVGLSREVITVGIWADGYRSTASTVNLEPGDFTALVVRLDECRTTDQTPCG